MLTLCLPSLREPPSAPPPRHASRGSPLQAPLLGVGDGPCVEQVPKLRRDVRLLDDLQGGVRRVLGCLCSIYSSYSNLILQNIRCAMKPSLSPASHLYDGPAPV